MFRRSLAIALALACPAVRAQEQSPLLPDAVIDLRTREGVDLVQGAWRFHDVDFVEVEHHAPGADSTSSGRMVKTRDIVPHAGAADFDDSTWEAVDPASLETRRTSGRFAGAWYRFGFTMPERVGDVSVRGASVLFEITADDYAEVWADGRLPRVLGQSGGPLIGGWNSPNRVVLTTSAVPGQRVSIAVFVANGPLSDPPANYVWIRSATIDVYKPGRFGAPPSVPLEVTRLDPAVDSIVPPSASAERLASGFSFVEGPVWVPEAPDGRYGGGGSGGYLLFSDPNRNVIHRWDPVTGDASIFRTKSGYSGVNIGAYRQPGSNGLALDPEGRLTICEHGNRRVSRVEKNGAITVLADAYKGNRLNSPNDLVYRSDGALYFTDPPFGLPKVFDDPTKELAHSGVYCLHQGELRLVGDDLAAPNGLAFSRDERHLYVDNWEETRKVILRYDVAPDGSLSNAVTFFDMTSLAPGEIALDGLKVDGRGNLFVAGPGGIWIISQEGRHLGTVRLPELPANFAWGGADESVLYITARTSVYRLRLDSGR